MVKNSFGEKRNHSRDACGNSVSGKAYIMAGRGQVQGKEWLRVVISELLEICAIWSLVDCQKTIGKMIEPRRKRLDAAIQYCSSK